MEGPDERSGQRGEKCNGRTSGHDPLYSSRPHSTGASVCAQGPFAKVGVEKEPLHSETEEAVE